MKNLRTNVLLGAVVVLGLLIIPIVLFFPEGESIPLDPHTGMPQRLPHTDHSGLIVGGLEDGPAVTRECLRCHPDSARQVMRTAHWSWEGEPVLLPGRSEPIRVGKKNLINNFCIGIQSNWPACTSCHAGYGWIDEKFDFSNADNVDCLACHDWSGTYQKGKGGLPAEGVDLTEAAKSVGWPKRENCGSCHFRGGGGDAVKHGDLDSSMTYPRESVDVHMGKYGLICIDCHQTKNHQIRGRSISVSVDTTNRLQCVDCHDEAAHLDERLNAHTQAVACETCHIPVAAIREATKTHWDWSAAGKDDEEEDPHEYLKIKGRFEYAKELMPEYYWYRGEVERYLLGDTIDPSVPTKLNPPMGDISDSTAKIFPFKVHRGNQIYDKKYRYFIQPKTAGEGGYWTDFDWDQAARLGSEVTGLPYSGEYDFAPTEMFWSLTHMVTPKENALQCMDCHGDEGRLDWKALGYSGDPIHWGGRQRMLKDVAAVEVGS
jgi:octaheme c-type cytochrome (tetrathionate reductase family)